jgi:hypothetical protein
MKKEAIKVKWIMKGIKVSSQKMRFLSALKQNSTLSSKAMNYINRYKTTYKKVIAEAKKGENDKYILTSNNPT